jgi:adenine-specific DNA-methyltransferase
MLNTNDIYEGTAQKLFEALDNDSVDLICTSPPYGIGMSYERAKTWAGYKEWINTWINEAYRVLKPSGSFWLNVGHMTVGRGQKVPLTYAYFELCPLYLVQEVVWHFPSGNDASRNRFCCRSERWMWFAHAPGQCYFDLDAVRVKTKHPGDRRNNPLGANPGDVWFFDQIRNNSPEKVRIGDDEHPCQYPRAMCRRIIKACCPEGGVVLDPFCGSGTTCYVASNLDRQYIGFELFPRFVKMAKKRLADDTNWMMF